MKLITSLLLWTLTFNSIAFHEESEFIPEASALCRIEDKLIIGGDEEPQSLWVSSPTEKLSKIQVSNARWDDLEGLATIDSSYFFATTSHSRTKKAKRKPEREQLMLFSFKSNKIEKSNSWGLREQVIMHLEKSFGKEIDIKTVESASPDDGGLNIEGLAYFDGKLYLGLRSPVTKSGKAIILTITNAKDLLTNGSPTFDKSIVVDLDGGGVRSLDADKSGLLILSGSRNDENEVFGLRKLSWGDLSLQKIRIEGFQNLIRPEGVVNENNGYTTFVQDFEAPQNQDIIVRLKTEN